jgi:streptogrisin C
MSFKKTALTSVIVSALAVGAAPALGADHPDLAGKGRVGAGDGSTGLSAGIRAALQRDLGLNAEQANRQGALQAKAIKLDEALRASLGQAYAGSSYNAKTGRLVVTVSDATQLGEVRAAGADARLGKHSKARLDAIKNKLDVAAGEAKGSGPADRQPNGPRQRSVAGMTSWYVDTETNTVRVTVTKAKAKAAARTLATYGDAVTIEESDLAPTTTAFMDGGDEINYGSCSAGFNLRNRATGVRYLLTAGHCVTAGSTLRGQGGVAFGPVLERWFPTFDDALARNDNPGYWIQGPWVDTNPSNGGIISVSGYTDAPVNTLMCKSGITTKWTCGRITAKDQTVLFDGTNTVRGLTRHSACVEKGDSGGSNVSVTNVYAAEGVTSGAQLTLKDGRLRCLSAAGQANVSWYFPIADSLAYYGPKYGVSVW